MTSDDSVLSLDEMAGLGRITVAVDKAGSYIWEKADFFAREFAGKPHLTVSRDCGRDEVHEFGRIIYVDRSVYFPVFGMPISGEPIRSPIDAVRHNRSYREWEHPVIPSALKVGEHYRKDGSVWVVVANDDDGDAFTCSRGARHGRNDYLFLAIKREMLTQIV